MHVDSLFLLLAQVLLAALQFAGVLLVTLLGWAAVLKARQPRPAPLPVRLTTSHSARLPLLED